MRRVTLVLVTSAALTVMASLPAPAAARVTTKATIFQAFTSTGAPSIPVRTKTGYCYTGALTVNRNDAWRCFVGNFILDPCFSSAKAGGVVVCPNVDVNGGVKIRLTRPLPRQMADPGSASLANQPWDIQLTNGRHCAFSSGATSVIHGLRLNYFCGAGIKYGLWGFPNRHAQPWTIWSAPFTAKRLTQRRAIRHVWM